MSGAKKQQSEPAEKSAKQAVGRRRPPVEHQFKKGVSGNPTRPSWSLLSRRRLTTALGA